VSHHLTHTNDNHFFPYMVNQISITQNSLFFMDYFLCCVNLFLLNSNALFLNSHMEYGHLILSNPHLKSKM
jgi:hypothetical protein